MRLGREEGNSQEGEHLRWGEKQALLVWNHGGSGFARSVGWPMGGNVQGRAAGNGCQAPAPTRPPVPWGVWTLSFRPEGLVVGEMGTWAERGEESTSR